MRETQAKAAGMPCLDRLAAEKKIDASVLCLGKVYSRPARRRGRRLGR